MPLQIAASWPQPAGGTGGCCPVGAQTVRWPRFRRPEPRPGYRKPVHAFRAGAASVRSCGAIFAILSRAACTLSALSRLALGM
jgi:hypothetical protein